MRLIVSIDTEEDNWLPYSQSGYSTENINRIPALQKLLSEFGVRPTYLVTYQVATNLNATAILKEIHQTGECEIGTHCHPWSQPPYEEAHVIQNSMLCNIPAELQARKIEHLHRTIQERFEITPTAFRSGRWGYSPAVASTLRRLDYLVDSSVVAYTDWRDCHGPDFSAIPPVPYRFDPPRVFEHAPGGALLEVPASVGYLQRYENFGHAIFEYIRQSRLRRLRLLGILDRLRFLNKVSLTPEHSSAAQMVDLVKTMRNKGHKLVTMWFHSSTLTPGLTPFVKTERDASAFLENVRQFLGVMKDMNVKTITLSEAGSLFPRT
jgi:hypothetical protein